MGARKLETWPIFILHKILMVSLADPGRRRAERLLKGQWRREGTGARSAGRPRPWAGLEVQPHVLQTRSPARGWLFPSPSGLRVLLGGF